MSINLSNFSNGNTQAILSSIQAYGSLMIACAYLQAGVILFIIRVCVILIVRIALVVIIRPR